MMNLQSLIEQAEQAVAKWDMASLGALTQKFEAIDPRTLVPADITALRAQLMLLHDKCEAAQYVAADVLGAFIERQAPAPYEQGGRKARTKTRARVCREYG